MATVKTGFTINDSARTAAQATSDRQSLSVLNEPTRLALRWVAGGNQGKPAATGEAVSATDATRVIADKDMEARGVNCATAGSEFNAEGGIKLLTAGADLDGQFIAPVITANVSPWKQFTWGTDREVEWEGIMQTGDSLVSVNFIAGLKLSAVGPVSTDANAAFFGFYPAVSANWLACISIDNVDSVIDTGIPVVANTLYVFGVKIDAGRKAEFFLNGGSVGKSTALKDTTDLIPMMGVTAAGVAAVKHCYVYGMSISRKVGLPS